MGKRIIPRARGAGGPRYVSPSHRFIGKVGYFPFGNVSGRVVDIVRDAIHSAPMMVIKTNDGKEMLQIAADGIAQGDMVVYGGDVSNGNVVELSRIPEGTRVFAIETYPGSGPKLCRSSGVFATVMSKTGGKVVLQFSAGRVMEFDERCRVTVGTAAGGGRPEKPWVSVGKKWHAIHAKGAKIYPRSAGVNMTPADHPYGGKSKRPRPSRTVSRDMPPGKKVGSIAARRVGRRKGARNV